MVMLVMMNAASLNCADTFFPFCTASLLSLKESPLFSPLFLSHFHKD